MKLQRVTSRPKVEVFGTQGCSQIWKTILARVRKAWSRQSRGSCKRVRVVTWVLLA